MIGGKHQKVEALGLQINMMIYIKDSINNARRGIIKITSDLINHKDGTLTIKIFNLIDFMPLYMYYDSDYDYFICNGISPTFDRLELGQAIPQYRFNITENYSPDVNEKLNCVVYRETST